MSIIDNLPTNDDGNVVFDVGAVNEGETRSITVDKSYLTTVYPELLNVEHLSNEDYQILLEKSTPMWKQAWEWARQQQLV